MNTERQEQKTNMKEQIEKLSDKCHAVLRVLRGLPARIKALTAEIRQEYTRKDLEHEFLPPALEIEETPPSPTRRILIWVIFAITGIAFLWSYFGEVDEVAVTRGKIIPDGKVKVIQPMETGVIRAIHVVEGQRVKEGQMLIEMDPTIKQADVESAVKNYSIHLTDKQRLLEELHGKAVPALPKAVENQVSPELMAIQGRFKDVRKAEYSAKEDAARAVVEQKRQALQSAVAILEKYRKTRDIVREQAKAYESAYKEDYISKMEHLEKQKELFTFEQEHEAQKNAVQQAREGLREAQQALTALKREREKTIIGDILEREKNISALEGEMIKAKKRYELERLASPVNGSVHGLQSYTVGGVVTPAQPLVTIVPEGTPLIIEAMAENKDIGFIKEGQEAEIKLDTFPFQKYGTIKGVVTSVSPDAFEDEKKGPIYKVKVAMEKTSVLADGRLVALAPGMAASVEVKTGRRKIIEFFLSPIIKYATESLTLR
jgi:hemolysin D